MVSTRSSAKRAESSKRPIDMVSITDTPTVKKRKTADVKSKKTVVKQNQASSDQNQVAMSFTMISIPTDVVYTLNNSTMKHDPKNIKIEADAVRPPSIVPMEQQVPVQEDNIDFIPIAGTMKLKVETSSLDITMQDFESPTVFNDNSSKICSTVSPSPSSSLPGREGSSGVELDFIAATRSVSPASTLIKEECVPTCENLPVQKVDCPSPALTEIKGEREHEWLDCPSPALTEIKGEREHEWLDCPSPALTEIKEERENEWHSPGCPSPASTIVKDECLTPPTTPSSGKFPSPASTIVKDEWQSPIGQNRRFHRKWSEMRFSVSPKKTTVESETHGDSEPDYGWEDPAPPRQKSIEDMDPDIKEKMQIFNNKLQNEYDLDAIQESRKDLFKAIEKSIEVQSQKKLAELNKKIQRKRDDYVNKLFGTNNFDSWDDDPALSGNVQVIE